jgi:hypothetical protein
MTIPDVHFIYFYIYEILSVGGLLMRVNGYKKGLVVWIIMFFVTSNFVLAFNANSSSNFSYFHTNRQVVDKEIEGKSIYILKGSGTVEDPYQIKNASDLNQTRNDLNANYTLMNDIDLNDYDVKNWNDGQGFIPIGSEATYFAGNFYGNNHTISNLYINRSGVTNIGLFGLVGIFSQTRFPNITYLKLEDVNISGGFCTGSLVGKGWGNFIGCTMTGTVTSNKEKVGGLIGDSYGDVINCSAISIVNSNSNAVGGLIGHSNYGKIIHCYSSGTVTSTVGHYHGGLVGVNSFGTIEECFTDSTVIGALFSGGLSGCSNGPIRNCYARGNVSGTYYVAGFVGDNLNLIKSCYSTGHVSGINLVKGFVALNAGKDSKVFYCYYDKETSGQSSGVGIERTTAQMTYDYDGYDPPNFGLYYSWDFNGTWAHDYSWNINDGYPYLGHPPDSPIINGPSSGKPNIEYDFSFNSTDPNDDPVMYNIDWGDNNLEWTEYSSSGEEIILKHSWSKKGVYTIKAKAIDINGAESDWSELEVNMPRDKTIHNSLIYRILEQFPLLQILLSFTRLI